MKITFLSLFTIAFLCVSLTFAQDNINEFPRGVTAYIKLQPRNSELIICEKSSSGPSHLKSIVSTFITDQEQIQRFLEKGFLFKTDSENCTGMLYHSQPEIVKKISLEKFRKQLPSYVQENFNKHAKSESNLNIKIEGKDSTVVVTFVDDNIELGSPRSSKGGSASLVKLPEKGSGDIIGVKGVAILQGSGLHQNMTKKLHIERKNKSIVQLDGVKDKCSIVLLDVLSEQTYVDQDEIRGLKYMDLKRFEVLDIEKPTETAKQYVWMIKMDVDDLVERSRNLTHVVISYLVHFRYQNPKEEAYSDSHLLLKTKFFTDCGYGSNAKNVTGDSIFYEEKVKDLYGKEFKQLVFEQSTLEGGKAADEIIVKVPVGDMKLKGIVTIVTLVVSIGGSVAILLFILGFGQKSKRD